MSLWVLKGFAQNHFAIIRGSVYSLKDRDSVQLTVNKIGDPFSGENISYTVTIKNQQYSFKIPVGKLPVHVSLTFIEQKGNVRFSNKLNNLALVNYYLENGDIINIKENKNAYSFTGQGAQKFRVLNASNSLQQKFNRGITWGDPLKVTLYFKKQDSLLTERMKMLELVKSKLSNNVFMLLKADMIGDYFSRYSFVNSLLPEQSIQKVLTDLRHYTNSVQLRYLSFKEDININILKLSSNYTLGLLTKFKYDSCTVTGKFYNVENSFNFFYKKYSGGLRERLILNAIYLDKDLNGNLLPYVGQALDVITDPDLQLVLLKLKHSRLSGAQAFEFTLQDTSGKMRSFSEFKGKIVLLDFWFTGCGSCRLSAPYLKKVEEYFSGKPVIFVTISLDKTKKLWVSTVKSKTYTSDQSINLFTNGKGFDHPIINYYKVDGCPTYILIDKKGRLMVNPENPRFDDGAALTSLIESELIDN